MTTQQKDALFKLNEFCNRNKIEYALIGTCALAILGVPSDMLPNDLDIKVYRADAEAAKKFRELGILAGLQEKEHPDTATFTFVVNGVKVNARLDNKISYKDMDRELISVTLVDEARSTRHLISVQTMQYAWAAKMKLNRPKDVKYALNVINLLSLPQ